MTENQFTILNESGKIFLQHVSAGLDAINAGVHAVRQKNTNRRVLVSNYIFLDDFASFCDRCLSAFPDVDLTCFDGTRTVSDYPTDTAPDLVIIPQQDFRGYTIAKAYIEPWCVMFHENYQFQSDCDGKTITREQLARESIIFDNSPYDRKILSSLFETLPSGLHFATQPDESRISINRCRNIGIVPVTALPFSQAPGTRYPHPRHVPFRGQNGALGVFKSPAQFLKQR